MDTTNRSHEVVDLDEVVDELIAYDAAEVRRACATTQAVPVVTVCPPAAAYASLPEEFTD
ncbi:hypothetical protein ACNHYB_08300 [Isoptericola jiangsuensis]|uniref:hypothetical protein n=1 Tax=Isoptericola jiangsuensis TaxID=548579 RepID=UPI003AABB514